MSLQYVIDAYNLINHPLFKTAKPAVNIQHCLIDFIKVNKLTGSKNNKAILVFDGYPPQDYIPDEAGLICLFSHRIEADELIKKIVEESISPRNIIVVSDDKQVQLSARLLRAQTKGVEEFVCGKKNNKLIPVVPPGASEFKLAYSAMQKINAELKKLWLG